MNREAREKIGATQWRSTAEVLHWFKGRDRNRRASFTQFDIEEFYPSISEALLLRALNYLKSVSSLTDEQIDVIMAAKKNIIVQ